MSIAGNSVRGVVERASQQNNLITLSLSNLILARSMLHRGSPLLTDAPGTIPSINLRSTIFVQRHNLLHLLQSPHLEASRNYAATRTERP